MNVLKFSVLAAMFLLAATARADAQSIVLERMSSPEETAALNKYPTLDRQLRFALDAGYSYRIGKIVDEIPDEFARKMRSGVHYGAELLYFHAHAWGFGAKFQGRSFNAELGSVKDKTNTIYAAPMVVSRVFDKKNRNAWIFGFSVGYLHFKEEVTAGNVSESISKGGLASTVEIGYDIRVSKRSFVGFKITLNGGSVDIDTYGDKKRENVSSLDISAGLRF